VLRLTRAWIASAALTVTAVLFLPGSAQAQAQQPRQGNQKPITNEQLTRAIQLAAVTTCNLSKEKVSFELALGASSNAVTSLIVQVHGGKFEGVTETLQPQQIFQSVTTNTAVQTYRICKELIPPESSKKIEEILKGAQSNTKK